ncbi:PD-(D/E)XK nuclease family protein [uncultured Brachyspira sp.]|uniref:PD-(D/E)XK nuclease family protein n=1 Tax=uncultured Brachyspira sp. TaxID=221953 RepID=UPI00259B65B5|nr:PD-(D/E)XK nuclease family protein [uncultured Brachyspira sp.]
MIKSLTKEENILLTLINAFQNDEKEKLNHLVNISKSLIEVREKVKEEMEKLPPQFNILNLIRRKNSEGRLLTYEPYNSNLLYQLLNIKKKNINFVKLFLEFMNGKFENKIDLNNIIWENVEAKNEYKNIDLLIRYKKYFAVIIENKIGYHDRDRQLEKYYNTMLEEGYGNNIHIIYLTPYGDNPSENSLPEEYYKKELYGKFANIRHAEIGYWLEGILKRQEFYFLNNEEENNKYKLLKSALIQIIDNEKSISGENEEGDMTETEIKKVLKENLFKELETKGKLTESELDKYIEMFDKAKDLLVKEKIPIITKKYLKFTKEINKYLNKNIKYELKSDKDIINNVINENFATHIYFKVNKIEIKIGSSYWIEKNNDIGSDYLIIIPKEDKSIKNKLKNNIKKFPNLEFEDQEENNRYYYEIDINNDKPEEIANAIDKLYELLKKEIK